MKLLNFVKNENLPKIAYKISVDVLFLLMVATAVLLIGDAILPGFFSAHFSFVRLTFALFALLAFSAFLAGKVANDKLEDAPSRSKKFLFILSVFLLICVGFILRVLPVWQIFVNAIFILVIFLLMPALVFRNNDTE